MAIAKIQVREPLEPFEPDEPIDKTILVIGGGITGLSAALGAAEAGYAVRLVDKAEELGGWSAKQHKSIPKKPPYRDLERSGFEQLVHDVESHENITVHKLTTVKRAAGQPGQFKVELQNGTNPIVFEAMDKGSMHAHPAVWMPNQQNLHNTYVKDKGTVVMNPNGSGARVITPPETAYFQPIWSPDGSMIARARTSTENLMVQVFRTHNGELETEFEVIDDVERWVINLDWSPDGTRLVTADEHQVVVHLLDGSATANGRACPSTRSAKLPGQSK